MIIDTRPEVIPGAPAWPGIRVAQEPVPGWDAPEESVEMTPAARDDTEGETLRRELAQGLCQSTWRNYPHTHLRDDPTIYTQHRCGRDLSHRGACRCRYCGRDRASA